MFSEKVLERNTEFYFRVVEAMQDELKFSEAVIDHCLEHPKFMEITTGAYRLFHWYESTIHVPVMKDISLIHVKRLRQMLKLEWKQIDAEIRAVMS